jgi:hypothetical protein
MNPYWPNLTQRNLKLLSRGRLLKIVPFTFHDHFLYPTEPQFCGLGEARLGADRQQGDIMPDVYRAPEVVLDMTWDYKVDIWNVGMVVR